MVTLVSTLTLTAKFAGENDVMVGGVVSATVTVISAGGSCTFPVLSIARLLIVAGPGAVGVQVKLQERSEEAPVGVAGPSTDTSTPNTDHPPASLAVPVMRKRIPCDTVAPTVGDVIVEVGGASTVT